MFGINDLCLEALQIFNKQCEELKTKVFAYVLMPNHFHCIIQSSNKGDVSLLMQRWKSLTARKIIAYCLHNKRDWLNRFANAAGKYKRQKDESYQVWLPRFDDFAIRDEDQFLTKLNYIHGNPLKHNLVDECSKYKFSSFSNYHGGDNSYIKITKFRE